MDVYEALYTTRAMRRVKPDPVPDEVQARIIDAAVRAPSGGNQQTWAFMLVDDPEVKAKLGPVYRECIDLLWSSFYNAQIEAAVAEPELPESKQWMAIKKSVDWAATNFETYPLFLFGFSQHDASGGSIYPAIWSAMLAARAEGVGSSLTSVMMIKGDEVPGILGVPADEGWNMACCVPMGYPLGTWGVAKRRPAHEVAYRNHWGQPVGFTIDEPLFP